MTTSVEAALPRYASVMPEPKKEAVPLEAQTWYFWGAVVSVLIIALLIVLLIIVVRRGGQPADGDALEYGDGVGGIGMRLGLGMAAGYAAPLDNLPVYVTSPQFSDPPERV
jgi:hypothetical protein